MFKPSDKQREFFEDSRPRVIAQPTRLTAEERRRLVLAPFPEIKIVKSSYGVGNGYHRSTYDQNEEF